MGGGGGGGGTKTTQSNETTGPPEAIRPYLETLTNRSWDWMEQNREAPAYVGPGAGSISANTGLFQMGAAGLSSPMRGLAQQNVIDTLGGKYLNPESNPAYQGWLEASFRPQAEQFRDILAPGIDAKFSAAGRPGSGAHFDTTMRGVQDLNRAQADAAAKSALGMYQGERQNQFTAQQLLPSFQTMDYRDVQGMQQAGLTDDAYAAAKSQYESTAQPEWLLRASQYLQGMYPGGTRQGTSTGKEEGGGGGGGAQTAQLVGAGVAAAASIAAAFI